MLDVMRFWLARGLDGFRCDAVPYLVERDGTSCENLPETHAVLKELRAVIDREYGGDRLLLAEANQWPEDVRPYFGDGDEFHMAFNFPLMPRLYLALRLEERRPIVDIYTHTPPIPPGCQWGLFLRNHDELTLEMVTNEERAFMYYAYAQDPELKLNLGIRPPLGPLLDNDRPRHDRVPAAAQREGARLPAAARARDGADRREPLGGAAARGARPRRVRWHQAARDARRHGLPPDPGGPVRREHRTARVLLVPTRSVRRCGRAVWDRDHGHLRDVGGSGRRRSDRG